jgi:hypothetical protein
MALQDVTSTDGGKIEGRSIISDSVEEAHRTRDPEIRQDGGLTAWSQVFACWLLFMNTWSVTLSAAQLKFSLIVLFKGA